MAARAYDPDATMLEARSVYFERNGFGPNGGYDDPWVQIEVAGIPLRVPNSAGRKRAVRYHDLHHLLTRYDTDMRGEAEISAWELASNCRGFIAAWALNLGALSYGLLACPRRVWAAFVRGRHTQNLYGRRFDEALMTKTVAELQTELGLDRDPLERPLPARPLDQLYFALAATVCLGVPLAVLTGLVGGVVALLG